MKLIAPVEVRTQRSNIKYLDELRILARKNRQHPTSAEYKMWNMVLKSRNFKVKFLRQKPIGQFILDFYCSKLMLDIEIDGESHNKKYFQDKNRDKYLETRGIKTIRYTNDQVLLDVDFVVNDLLEKIKDREKELLFSPFSRENARSRYSRSRKRVLKRK